MDEQGRPDPLISPDEFQSKVNSLALAFVYLFIGAFIATYIKNTCWYASLHIDLTPYRMLSGSRIARSVRQAYLKVSHSGITITVRRSYGKTSPTLINSAQVK